MKRNISIGVDVGGSHIKCAAIDLESRKIIRETVSERRVDNAESKEVIISTWADALASTISLVDTDKLAGIGFAMPGPFDYVKGISLIRGVKKYENLYGVDIVEALGTKLVPGERVTIRFMNDASSFAVGESWAGQASKVSRSMSITLGTGFGSAFVENGVPVVNGDSVPELGCVYHFPYRDGIADDYFSTRWFTSAYSDITGSVAEGVKEVAARARSDGRVADLFRQFGSSLGSYLAPFLLRFGAEKLVIGGNIARAYDLFDLALDEGLRSSGCEVSVAISDLMEDSALLGSACLLEEGFWNRVKDSLKYM